MVCEGKFHKQTLLAYTKNRYLFQRPKCEKLLDELTNIIRRDKAVLLSGSFLTVYPYLFINEPANITNQCIDYIMTNTGNTLVHLLHSDIKVGIICIY